MSGYVFRDCINVPGGVLPGQDGKMLEKTTIAYREEIKQGFEGRELHYLEHRGVVYCLATDVEYGRGDPDDFYADRVLFLSRADLAEICPIGTVLGDNLRAVVEEIHPGVPGGR